MLLQIPRDSNLQEYIRKQGEILHDEYFECRNNPKLLNDQNSAEVSFEELTKDPVKSMEEIY